WESYENSSSLKYYNILSFRMDPIRGDYSERTEWQRTLRLWNKQPVIDPDIVPIENIKDFVAGNIVHDIWVARKANYASLDQSIETIFHAGISASTLKDNFDLILSS